MSDYSSDLLVPERRRINRRQLTSSRKPAVVEEKGRERKVSGTVTPEPESVPTAAELTIAERREIIDRRRLDRRRQIDPTTCERDYSDNEIEFMRSMDDYKRKSGRPFPTWSEVLEVLMSLGYRKVADPSTMEWRTFGEQRGSL